MIDTAAILQSVNLLDLVGASTKLRKTSAHQYNGPCPKCGGTDRFTVDPTRGWFCRQCTGEPGNGGEFAHWNDSIDFLRWLHGIDFQTACVRLGGRNLNASKQELDRIAAQRTQAEAAQLAEERKHQAEAVTRLQSSQAWEIYHHHSKSYAMWAKRGLSETWVRFWRLGYCPAHEFTAGDITFGSPTLTIPYWRIDQAHQWQCIGLRHRLLLDGCPGGKYRPEFSGLGNHLFYADPVQVRDRRVLIVEGEIKAMVTWAALWDDSNGLDNTELAIDDLAVIGIPGKSWKPEYLDDLKEARRVFVCLDPDANEAAQHLAGAFGEKATVIKLPGKIDDLINSKIIDMQYLVELLK